ncbi:MAG: DUF4118 domain-containing protein [Solirubrobacterales bacterium]|nr:DUF4118 domain-containing protein [Solirubrobacterales bacterium]
MPDRTAPGEARRIRPGSKRAAAAISAEVVLAVAAATAGVAALQSTTPITGLGILYLLAVLVIAIRRGQVAALATAVLGGLAFNYFFITPRHRLAIAHSDDLIDLIVLLIAAVVVGRLAAVARQRAGEVEARAALASALRGSLRDPFALDSYVDQPPQGLDLSKIEAGAIVPQADWCDLHDAVASAVAGLHTRHPIEFALPDDLPLVRADAAQLERVFSNLVGNAVKFSPAGSPVRITGSSSSSRVTVRVTDQGRGISKQDRPHVFEPFFSGRGQPGAGSGLGLAICRGFVEANGGRIVLQTGTGRGTSFAVTFPVAPRPTRAEPGVAGPAGEEAPASRAAGAQTPGPPHDAEILR